MGLDATALRATAEEFGQEQVFRFWEQLDAAEQGALLEQIASIDFPLMQRLSEAWILHEPEPESFAEIAPVPCIARAERGRPDADEAWAAGETALRAGRVGLFLVAGGQGTRLGFEGPKGSYPIGPISGKSLFQYHAEKILNLQRRYGCTLPWYIMVSDTNGPATIAFFESHDFFGLDPAQVKFITQSMVPCVDNHGKFMLEAPGRLAMNPNGHGGSIPAMVDTGVLEDARARGVDILSYFQVDNWAVKVADPYFIGYHALRGAEMSSKNHRKHEPRESVGVHCLCDGEYRVIEYSELDIYPQLLETDADGKVVYYAGNPAIHLLSVDFVQRVYDRFHDFPWHVAHKKIPYLDAAGALVHPEKPNGYKFETFVFDALRFADHAPVALEIHPEGEYTPIKEFEGPNSVTAARRSMNRYWAKWLAAAGAVVPRDAGGEPTIQIEISPAFALDEQEFIERAGGLVWPAGGDISIDAEGRIAAASHA